MSTPAKDTLDIWPALPLVIQYRAYLTDNTITVLERGDRMCQIDLMDISSSHLGKVSAAMQNFSASAEAIPGVDIFAALVEG